MLTTLPRFLASLAFSKRNFSFSIVIESVKLFQKENKKVCKLFLSSIKEEIKLIFTGLKKFVMFWMKFFFFIFIFLRHWDFRIIQFRQQIPILKLVMENIQKKYYTLIALLKYRIYIQGVHCATKLGTILLKTVFFNKCCSIV